MKKSRIVDTLDFIEGKCRVSTYCEDDNGQQTEKLFDNFYVSFYLWLNFLNLMIGLSCSLLRFSYRLLMVISLLLQYFFRPIRINNIHQCLKKIYDLIIAFGRLSTFIFRCVLCEDICGLSWNHLYVLQTSLRRSR